MHATDRTAQRWRELFLDVMSSLPDVPILLSGGTDSAAILSAALALGRKPDCYTYSIGGVAGTDLRVAQLMCDTFELQLHVIDLPRDHESLVRDIREIVARLGTTRKAAVQCAHPMWYMARAIAHAGFDATYCGTGGVIEDNRTGGIILNTQGEEAFREYRRKNLTPGYTQDGNGTWAMHTAAQWSGVALLEPLVMEPFATYSLSLDAREINRPVQKGIAMRAFPEFWSRGRWRRTNSPMQVNSGLRDWHATLLNDPAINRRGRKSMAHLYADITSEDDQ